MKTLFEICQPREDVLRGLVRESEFAADLASVLRGEGPKEYKEAGAFFANTYPTVGLKSLLQNVFQRLSGVGGEANAIFRLDTQYGGGKTHALIALAHVASGAPGVANIQEFLDPALVPREPIRVAAFDGENANPTDGRDMGEGVKAFTPWGELAFLLGGKDGYEKVRRSDEERRAPGAESLKALFAGQPRLILLDELSIYLRKVRGWPEESQLTPFLTGLFKAVESSPRVVLVFTLAIGRAGTATDAYAEENEFLAEKLAEAESVAARKATLLEPTAEDEAAAVLRRRLFASIDDAAAAEVVDAYEGLWRQYSSDLPPTRVGEDRRAEFQRGYPFHPALMACLTDKLATLDNFQRIRGMLRLLAQGIARTWHQKPASTYALHLHHLDPSYDKTYNEVVTRLGLRAFDPAVRNDVAIAEGTALAQQIDAREYPSMPPFGSFIARTILWHSFAFNEPLKGATPEELRFAALGPGVDLGFVNDARQKFVESSAYLDDRPGAPLRFLTEANLNQIVRRQEKQVDREQVRVELRDRIRQIFDGSALSLVPFAAGPEDVPDAVEDGRPFLALLSYEAETVRGDRLAIPELVERIYRYRGAQNDFRILGNNLVFLVADEALRERMRDLMTRRLALEALTRPDLISTLVEHQQQEVRERYQKSEQALAAAIQSCYRHVFFPTRKDRLEGAMVDLGHTAIDQPSASERPGAGQQAVLRVLENNSKLLRGSDAPLAPAYVRDQTPLKKGQISTAALRNEFRKDPRLPILLGDDNFFALIRKGIEEEVYVYRSGDLLLGKGDPWADIRIDENSVVFTTVYARQQGIWPRPAPGVQPPSGGGPGPGPGTGPEPPPPSPPAPRPGVRTFRAEAPLREALTRIWDQARDAGVQRLRVLRLRVFDHQDAFKLLTVMNGVSNAKREVSFEVEYETSGSSTLELRYRGTPDDAQPVKEFVDTQFRSARDKSLDTIYTLEFTEGLKLDADDPTKLTERLSRFASGAAFVEAEAESAPSEAGIS
jgi:hypothetical protein